MSALREATSILNGGSRRSILLGVQSNRQPGSFSDNPHSQVIPCKRRREDIPHVRLEHTPRNGDETCTINDVIKNDIILGGMDDDADSSFQNIQISQRNSSIQETESSSNSTSTTSVSATTSSASVPLLTDDLVRQITANDQLTAPVNIAVGPGGQLFAILPAVTATARTLRTSIQPRRVPVSLKPDSSRSVVLSSNGSSPRSSESPTVRETRRRMSHNEIERRRRDKITNQIMKLADIIPDCPSSKSEILSRTCDYVVELQDLIVSLRHKLADMQSGEYDRRIAALESENEALRDVLEQNGILVCTSDSQQIS